MIVNVIVKVQIFIKGGAFALIFGNNPKLDPPTSQFAKEILTKTKVFARMAPEQKKNLILVLRKNNNPLDLISNGDFSLKKLC